MPHALVDLDAYFARIGYAGHRAPSFDILRALHAAHVSTIPFENLDVLLGRGIRIDLDSIERKLVRDRRGGYCFEHNTLFAAVLRTLGFDVITLAARVLWNVPNPAVMPRTHMTLLVTFDRRRYLADVGFGGVALTEPLLFEPMRNSSPSRRIVRGENDYLHQVWRNESWSDVYRFTLEPHIAVDYELANWFTSTHPASRFRQNLIVARSGRDRHTTLMNRELTVRHHDGRVDKRAIATPQELLAVLAEGFDLHFPPETRFGPPGSGWPT
jgi:N-hydroxyarylamine O-acetyltransferase